MKNDVVRWSSKAVREQQQQQHRQQPAAAAAAAPSAAMTLSTRTTSCGSINLPTFSDKQQSQCLAKSLSGKVFLNFNGDTKVNAHQTSTSNNRITSSSYCSPTSTSQHSKHLSNDFESISSSSLLSATCSSTTTTTPSLSSTSPVLALNKNNEIFTKINCDTNINDLYLVNHRQHSRSTNFNDYQIINCKASSGPCRSSSSSASSSCSIRSTARSQQRHSTPMFSSLLMFLLQLSAVVFISSLNIGFVTAAVASSASSSNNTGILSNQLSSSDARYILDYEESGNGLMSPAGHFTHTWAVHIPEGDREGKADAVARDHGFVNMGKIFNDHYHFAHHKVSKRSLSPAQHHQTRLDEDDRVHWSQQQVAKSRRKRDFIRMRPSRTSSRSSSSLTSLVDAFPFNDPKWSQMWYLNRGGDLDMNVIPAWKEGITGKGIVVTILDDGLESDHPDILSNYDPKASYDVNSHDDDPMPHYDLTDSNRHGTRCAGEVAATANNSICAVGIAFGASVGGVRMLDGDVTDAVEARSLSLNPQHIDIYSASWGPDDDGKTVDGPGELASRAFIEGVTKGRAGKGSIFIWASGNGGRELDNCNCDGYTNSIWTLSISSATEEGHVPWYSEKCSSTLATTYSSGGQLEKQVVTTDLHHSCTASHTGTSASAPLAAGIAALVLESNTNLTWRDLQHIVVRTAKPANLKDPNWSKNGVGRRVSHSFGYGLMDAATMVKVARNWKTVPEQQRCEINAPHVDKVIPPKSHITLQLSVKNCLNINFLEHVQAKITLTSQRRGDIQLNLISPAGTKVTLLTTRVHDISRSGFNQWPFMSVHTWGESPHGNWQLEIHNEGRFMAQITQWDLIFYGTETPAQPDDPVPVNSQQFNAFGNDMEHNDIEYDSSGQWRNMQQVGESSMMSHDRTNTSCLKATINRQCLECAPPTFFYHGRCYDECPMHTYAHKNKDKELNEIITNNNKKENNDVQEDYDELQSLDRRRRRRHLRNSRKATQGFFIDDLLTPTAPSFPSAMPTSPSSVYTCEPCDKSCARCHGPLGSQCSTCPVGSQLRKLAHTNETYCINFSERSTANGAHMNTKEHSSWAVNIGGVILIGVAFSIVSSLVVYFVVHWKIKQKSQSNNVYDRVALIPEDALEADEDDDDDDDEEEHEEILYKSNIKIYRDHVEPSIEIEKLLEEAETTVEFEAVENNYHEVNLKDLENN